MTYLKDRVLHAIKVFTAVIVVAVLLAVPVGEAFAAGLLKQGSSGAEVTQLQQELMNRGYFTYWRTTGYFGTKTKQSVINFQKAAGLTPDGIVGPKTHAALFTNTANRSAISQKE
jgi:N-acetylmuramoyl-L-alanine amidase